MPKLGPTGVIIDPPIRTGDQGGLFAGVGRVPGMRALTIDFGTSVAWTAIRPVEAKRLAKAFRDIVQRNFGNLGYNAAELPITVVPNIERHVVESTFRQQVGILVADPEVFLAWAERLDAAADKLLSPKSQAN